MLNFNISSYLYFILYKKTIPRKTQIYKAIFHEEILLILLIILSIAKVKTNHDVQSIYEPWHKFDVSVSVSRPHSKLHRKRKKKRNGVTRRPA